MGLLDGKVAIVTGGGRGIGRSHALMLAAEGAAVLVNDLGSAIDGTSLDETPAEQVVEEIRGAGGQAAVNTGDVSDWAAAGAIVDQAVAEFGRLDILVNNAGINQYRSIDQEDADSWNRVLRVNLTGTAAMMHWASRHWTAEGPALGRALVNTASPAGTNPPPGATAYCVSKAGVAALTMATATELAHLGVRVNAIAPMARSRMSESVPKLKAIMAKPEGFDRMSPDNVARLMRYLASPACRFTGRIFGVDGDDIYLFEGMSAETHVSNGGREWTQDGLAAALETVDQQDHAYMIAPSLHVRMGAPKQEVLDAFDKIGRGEPVRVWKPVTAEV